MDLILKGLLGAALIIGIGLFARRGENALAAVLIQVPVITMMGFWAVGQSGGGQGMSRLALAALLSAPLFWAAVVPVWLLGKTVMPWWSILLVALILWLVTTVLWVWLLHDRL